MRSRALVALLSLSFSLPLLGLSAPASAETFQECRAQGCNERDCAAASQNGFTCASWRCFKRCVDDSGFPGGCLAGRYQGDAYYACVESSRTCESRCQ